VPPTPVSNDLRIDVIGMPTASASATDTTINVMNGFSLKRAISTTSATIAINA
jgi:hypothetical protein